MTKTPESQPETVTPQPDTQAKPVDGEPDEHGVIVNHDPSDPNYEIAVSEGTAPPLV